MRSKVVRYNLCVMVLRKYLFTNITQEIVKFNVTNAHIVASKSKLSVCRKMETLSKEVYN